MQADTVPFPVVHLVAGSTGAGKTTYAIALAEKARAMRFSIDEWMGQLFWMDSPQPIRYDWAIERVARCEDAIFANVRRLAALGIPSVLDLGFTKAEQRGKFYRLARAHGIPVVLHFLDIPAEERWRRVIERNRGKGETFAMEVDRGMFEFMEGLWEPPSDEEIEAAAGIRIRDRAVDIQAA